MRLRFPVLLVCIAIAPYHAVASAKPQPPTAILQSQEPPTLRAPPFKVRYWLGGRRLAARVLNLALRTQSFPGIPDLAWRTREIEILLAPSEGLFAAITGGRVPAWGAGVTIPSRSLVVLPAYNSRTRGGPLDYGTVLRHELAHIALHRMVARGSVPRWFDEGYATWTAGQLDWEAGWRLRFNFAMGKGPPLDSLELDWPRETVDARLAYLLSASVIDYLVQESGPFGLQRLFERVRGGEAFEQALRETYGLDSGSLEHEWQKYVRGRYGWVAGLTQTVTFFLIAAAFVVVLFVVGRRRRTRKLAVLRATEMPDAPAFWTEGGIEIVAHRGFSARAPENTLAAMELAIRYGAPALEFDLRASRDGVPVVIHDETLERTTNGKGRVADQDWAELEKLDAGHWFSPLFVDEPLPRLEDVLRTAFERVHRLYIELKPHSFTAQQLETVVEQIVHYRFVEQAIVMSFDWLQLEHIRSLPTPITIAFLADDERTFLQALQNAHRDGNAIVDCNYRILIANPSLAQKAAELNIELAVYTVNDTRSAATLVQQGVRRLTSNEVEKLLKWAAGREAQPD
jgi:glycerophosphoryl diester phosphodiesterase